MGPLESSRGRAERSLSSSPVRGPSEVEASSTSRRWVLASVRGQRRGCLHDATDSYKMSRVICLIRFKQLMLCFTCRKYEQHTSALSWHDEPPAWPRKLSISEAQRERRRRRD